MHEKGFIGMGNFCASFEPEKNTNHFTLKAAHVVISEINIHKKGFKWPSNF